MDLVRSKTRVVKAGVVYIKIGRWVNRIDGNPKVKLVGTTLTTRVRTGAEAAPPMLYEVSLPLNRLFLSMTDTK